MARVERLLRWVWLIIGTLVLVSVAALLAFIGMEAIGGGGSGAVMGPDSSVSAREAPAEVMRYEPPRAIGRTATRIVLIRRGTAAARRGSYSSSGEAPAVNVAFLEGDAARLLLDRPAYIRRVTFPGASEEGASDSLRWVVLEMALEDTDRNGKLDELDRRSLYAAGLDGRGLRRVTPPGYELLDWRLQPGGSLVATALQVSTARSAVMPERAFVLGADGGVRPYAALDSVVNAAASIVAKP